MIHLKKLGSGLNERNGISKIMECSGPAEAEIVPLEMPKNWITNSVNFIKKIFKSK